MTKNEKYVRMIAEKRWRQDYHTIVEVYTTQSGCVLTSHTHTFISTSVAAIIEDGRYLLHCSVLALMLLY